MSRPPWTRDAEGWLVIRTWGRWYLVAGSRALCIQTEPVPAREFSYWVSDDRWAELDWVDHVSRKTWCSAEDAADLEKALAWCRALTAMERSALTSIASRELDTKGDGEQEGKG